MFTIRKSVFETNSSSMHSLSIGNIEVKASDLLPIEEDGNIYVNMKGYYGETEKVNSFERKLAHIFVLCQAIDLYSSNTESEFTRTSFAISSHQKVKDAVISVYRTAGITTTINDVVMEYECNDGIMRCLDSLDEKQYPVAMSFIDADGLYYGDYSYLDIVNLLLYLDSYIDIDGE